MPDICWSYVYMAIIFQMFQTIPNKQILIRYAKLQVS